MSERSTHRDDPDDRAPAGEFMRLFMAHQRRIYGLIRSMVLNPADADDLFQESITVLWQKFDEFTPGTDFAAWALAVARFRVMAWRKRQTGHAMQLSDALAEGLADRAIATGLADDARAEALRQCLASLTDRNRRIIELRYADGMTVPRVAEQLGQSAPTVYRLLAAVHKALFRCIRRNVEEGA